VHPSTTEGNKGTWAKVRVQGNPTKVKGAGALQWSMEDISKAPKHLLSTLQMDEGGGALERQVFLGKSHAPLKENLLGQLSGQKLSPKPLNKDPSSDPSQKGPREKSTRPKRGRKKRRGRPRRAKNTTNTHPNQPEQGQTGIPGRETVYPSLENTNKPKNPEAATPVQKQKVPSFEANEKRDAVRSFGPYISAKSRFLENDLSIFGKYTIFPIWRYKNLSKIPSLEVRKGRHRFWGIKRGNFAKVGKNLFLHFQP
jgi:hypothetical protein